MRKIKYFSLLTFSCLFYNTQTQAQVTQNVLVEQFTNTRCSNCASRNPGFRTNLNNHPEVLHISYHPSSPYSSCVLNQHNKSENDSRTKYYGIYGATPRLVVQGDVVSRSTNYGNASIFSGYTGKTSPFDVKLETVKSDADSLVAKLTLKTTVSHSYSEIYLIVPAVEDTVFYIAPNGENEHYNVFRKMFSNESLSGKIPAVGDSMVMFLRTATDGDWDASHMYAMAIVQDSATSDIIQAGKSDPLASNGSASVNYLDPTTVSVFPNPFENKITIETPWLNKGQLSVSNAIGQTVHSGEIKNGESIDLTSLDAGVYYIQLRYDNQIVTKKVFKSL